MGVPVGFVWELADIFWIMSKDGREVEHYYGDNLHLDDVLMVFFLACGFWYAWVRNGKGVKILALCKRILSKLRKDYQEGLK